VGTLAEHELAGPTPASGSKVSNLYAVTNGTVAGTETVEVAVIDNTTGKTLLACKVTATSKGHCENATESTVVASPGDYLEVQITSSNVHCTLKSWLVTFRR